MVRNTLLSDAWLPPFSEVFGKLTPIEGSAMNLAVTIKMMSRTRVISTSGVTLMPVIASSSGSKSCMVFWFCRIFALHENQQYFGGGIHLRYEFLYFALEIVERNDGGDCDK